MWYHGLVQRAVEAVCVHPSHVVSAFLKHISWNVVWARCFQGVNRPQGSPDVSWVQAEKLLIWAGNRFLFFPPAVLFCASTLPKKLVSLLRKPLLSSPWREGEALQSVMAWIRPATFVWRLWDHLKSPALFARVVSRRPGSGWLQLSSVPPYHRV